MDVGLKKDGMAMVDKQMPKTQNEQLTQDQAGKEPFEIQNPKVIRAQ